VCKKKRSHRQDNNKQTKKKRSFKEIAIQVHELKLLDSDVHSHAKMANQAKRKTKTSNDYLFVLNSLV
jgi:hypothetical protein